MDYDDEAFRDAETQARILEFLAELIRQGHAYMTAHERHANGRGNLIEFTDTGRKEAARLLDIDPDEHDTAAIITAATRFLREHTDGD